VEYEKDSLKKELNQYKEKYVEYNETYQKLKKEFFSSLYKTILYNIYRS